MERFTVLVCSSVSECVFALSRLQLDVLEYIHEHEYVHADIKASNLLLSYQNPNQVSTERARARLNYSLRPPYQTSSQVRVACLFVSSLLLPPLSTDLVHTPSYLHVLLCYLYICLSRTSWMLIPLFLSLSSWGQGREERRREREIRWVKTVVSSQANTRGGFWGRDKYLIWEINNV